MKAFFRESVLMVSLVLGILSGLGAQEVPGAIKYQAVLRDVNGKALADKENVNLRISLRLDDPISGQIAYSEEHMGVSTNAYGVIHLEIGRGMVTSGTDLHDVPWAGREIYVQIEIETDGTGYTHMGDAELLTVPYAFYAENASGDNLYGNLDDNFLPKFNATGKTLVNSGISQTGRALEVDASSITFINKADGNMKGYRFPMTVGRRGQVLRLSDNVGTLDWADVEGGGGGVDLNLKGDGHLLYWNDQAGELDTVSLLRYDYQGTRNLELNTDITGTNNLLVSDKLGEGQIWVGDNYSRQITPVRMHGHVSMDKTGKTSLNLDGHVLMDNDKTRLNLAMKGGIKLIPGANGDQDTLAVESAGGGGESLWETKPSADGYNRLYPKGVINETYVGIGHDNPVALLHVHGSEDMLNPRALFSDCHVEFAGKKHDNTAYSPTFLWNPEKASLFAGATSDDVMVPSVGNYSVALGVDASALPEHTLAFGLKSTVTVAATDAFAIGNNSRAGSAKAIALGRGAVAEGENSVALGFEAVAGGVNSVVLGHSQKASANAVVVGYSNFFPTGIGNAVVVGRNNAGNNNGSVVVGYDNMMESGSILVGKDIQVVPSTSVIVSGGEDFPFGGATVLGHVDEFRNGLVAVGQANTPASGRYVNMFGSWLDGSGSTRSLTMIGDQISLRKSLSGDPIFMYGSSDVFFEIAAGGDAYFSNDVYATGLVYDSDARLKDDIRSMFWTPALLDSINPVSYFFKSDKQKRVRFGFIAQDVRKIFPELVHESAKGMLSLDYIGLVPVLWQINRELSHKVDALEDRLEEQLRRQAELENELQAIKAKLGM